MNVLTIVVLVLGTGLMPVAELDAINPPPKEVHVTTPDPKVNVITKERFQIEHLDINSHIICKKKIKFKYFVIRVTNVYACYM